LRVEEVRLTIENPQEDIMRLGLSKYKFGTPNPENPEDSIVVMIEDRKT